MSRCAISHASSARHVLLCTRSVQLVRVKLGVYLCSRCMSWPSRLVSGLIELRRVGSYPCASSSRCAFSCWSSNPAPAVYPSFALLLLLPLLPSFPPWLFPSFALSLCRPSLFTDISLLLFPSFPSSLFPCFLSRLLFPPSSSIAHYSIWSSQRIVSCRVVSCRRCQNKKLPYRGR